MCKMKDPKKPPSLIYIPTQDLMRKMIKACIKVPTTQKLMSKMML